MGTCGNIILLFRGEPIDWERPPLAILSSTLKIFLLATSAAGGTKPTVPALEIPPAEPKLIAELIEGWLETALLMPLGNASGMAGDGLRPGKFMVSSSFPVLAMATDEGTLVAGFSVTARTVTGAERIVAAVRPLTDGRVETVAVAVKLGPAGIPETEIGETADMEDPAPPVFVGGVLGAMSVPS